MLTQFGEYVLCIEFIIIVARIYNVLINICMCIGGAYFIDNYAPSKC